MVIDDSALNIPDEVLVQLDAADRRKGFPPGTMQSIMQQEIGGQFDKFLNDPAAHHFEPDETGKRRAPNGKVSSAFGPFGILESTAADPGFNTAPLKDRSLESQIEFAADYLANRSKKNGLADGLAKYGEGRQYAAQVLNRIGLAPESPVAKQKPISAPIPRPTPVRPGNTAAAASKQPVVPVPKPNTPILPPQSNNNITPQHTLRDRLNNSPTFGIQAPTLLTSLAQIAPQGTEDIAPQVVQPLQPIPAQRDRIAALDRLRQIQGTEVNL